MSCPSEVEILPSVTSESSGLYSATSELHLKVEKSDKDDLFYCEVTYFVPAGTRMTETDKINVTVYCKFHIVSATDILFFFHKVLFPGSIGTILWH